MRNRPIVFNAARDLGCATGLRNRPPLQALRAIERFLVAGKRPGF
jgi:hypothetical protein